MKKIISILLAMLMIMPFAVPFASAADAIGTIAVTIDTADLGGKSVDSYADYVTLGTEGVIFEESNGPAVEAFNKTTESYDSEFEGGNYYTFTVKLTEAPYYALPAAGSFAEVEVNGSKYAALVQEKSTVSGTISYILFEIELYVGDPMKNLKAIDFHVPAPVAGAVPADLSQVTADNMGVNIIGIEWFPDDPTFVEGTQYTFQLALETAEGFTFDKNIYLSHDMADAVKIGSGKNELKMSYTFPATPGKTKITEINATVVEPVVGEAPSDVVTTTGTGYTVALYDWYHSKDLMGTITEFEGGNTYHVQVIFTPESGYVFADDVTATINGKTADLRLSNSNTGAKIFDLEFAQLPVPEYDISVTNGTASASKAVAGTTVTLTADAAPAGKVFDKWIVTGATVADSSSATTTFTMPKNDVTVEATYKDKTYNVAVTNGTASVSEAAAGTTVTLTADAAPAGKVFDKWVVTGATVTDTSKATTTFTMPENDVTAEATYKDKTYNVAVTSGTASSSKAVAGTTVTLTADAAPGGKVFDKWVVSGATVADTSKATTTFTMPENDVTAQATYKDKTYNVAVTSGTASSSKAVAGTTVTLTADAAPAGKVFDKWVVSGATVADTSKATTTFTMPENDVTAQATYKNVVYKVTVTNGKASASTAVMGDSITFTANQIDGKVFSHWEISGSTVSDKNAKETTVTVGTSDVTAEAVYEDCPCKCHQGGIAGFFYKIVLFFQKLFGKNTICEFCGAKH